MNESNLNVYKRKIFGRKTKALRSQGTLPANIYGKNIKSLAIQVSEKDFTKILKETGETSIINLSVEKESKKRPVLVTNLQKDPVTDFPIHVDFHQVDLKQKVTVQIPVEIKGVSPAVKEKGGVLITLLDEIKVEALPNDLPNNFTVDISTLNDFGHSITVKDLKVEKKKITLLVEEAEAIVVVQEPKKEEEPVSQDTEAAEDEESEEDSESETETSGKEGEKSSEKEAKKGGEDQKSKGKDK